MKKQCSIFKPPVGLLSVPTFRDLLDSALSAWHTIGGDDGDGDDDGADGDRDGGDGDDGDLSQGGYNDVLYMCVWYKGYDISEQDDPLLPPLGYLDNITLCNFITFKASNWRFSNYLL